MMQKIMKLNKCQKFLMIKLFPTSKKNLRFWPAYINHKYLALFAVSKQSMWTDAQA